MSNAPKVLGLKIARFVASQKPGAPVTFKKGPNAFVIAIKKRITTVATTTVINVPLDTISWIMTSLFTPKNIKITKITTKSKITKGTHETNCAVINCKGALLVNKIAIATEIIRLMPFCLLRNSTFCKRA